MPTAQSGAALLEYMIAIMISVIVITCVLQTYTLRTRTIVDAYQQNLSIGQQASALLRDVTNRAGNFGCRAQSQYQKIAAPPALGMYLQPPLMTHGTDLIVQFISNLQGGLIRANAKNELLVQSALQFKAGQIAVISDCLHADLFKIKSTHQRADDQLLEIETPLQTHYGKFATVAPLEHYRFYIEEKKRAGLYVEDIHHIKHFLLNDIQQLQVVLSAIAVRIQFKLHNKYWLVYAPR